MQLYLKRFLSGPFVNDVKNSHFRDPMLPFYWLETTGVRLGAFDTQGLKSSSIYFRTLSGNSTTWPFLFENNCLLVENNTQISYTDMGELCAYSSFRPKSVDGLSQKAVFFFGTSSTCSDDQFVWSMLNAEIDSGVWTGRTRSAQKHLSKTNSPSRSITASRHS